MLARKCPQTINSTYDVLETIDEEPRVSELARACRRGTAYLEYHSQHFKVVSGADGPSTLRHCSWRHDVDIRSFKECLVRNSQVLNGHNSFFSGQRHSVPPLASATSLITVCITAAKPSTESVREPLSRFRAAVNHLHP